MNNSSKNIKSQLDTFNPVDSGRKEIKQPLQIYINDRFVRSKKDIVEEIKEWISVELLYSDENLKGSVISFRILRNFLVLKRFQYDSDPGTNKIMYG